MRTKPINRLCLEAGRLFSDKNKRQTGVFEDYFLLPAGLLTAAFFGVEQNYLRFSRAFIMGADDLIEKLPGFLRSPAAMLVTDGMTLVGRVLAVLILLVVVSVAFSNGVRRRVLFVLLAAATVLLPRIWLALMPEPDYNRRLMNLLTNLSDLFARKPFSVAAAWLGRSPQAVSTLLLLLILFAFTMGWVFGARFCPNVVISTKIKH